MNRREAAFCFAHMLLAMNFNFNIYRGRQVFNLNFAARSKAAAVKAAENLVPSLPKLRWVLWSCPDAESDWKRIDENPAATPPRS